MTVACALAVTSSAIGAIDGAVATTASGQPSSSTVASSGRYWAMERDSAGKLHVVRFRGQPMRMQATVGRQLVSDLQPDSIVTAGVDTYEPQQWGLTSAGFPSAWAASTGGNVVVAVIDSGVRKTHQDLVGAVLPGVDYVTGSGDGSNDQNGHGTHVAGIIAARRNGIGTVGGAPNALILPLRVLDANGSGYTSNVADAIVYAADHGARVVNLSLGGPSPAAGMQTAMQYALSKGTIVFAAAGNNAQSGNPVMYPAAYPEAVAVAAIDNYGNRAAFSSFGSYVDIAAPGSGIVSTWGTADNAYATASGTSMATPYAAAAAALIIAKQPTLSVAQIKGRLAATATDLAPAGPDIYTGYGKINPTVAMQGGAEGSGYWVVGGNGRVRAYGNAKSYGDLAGAWITASTVASTRTSSGKGYWLTTSDGHVFAYGDAKWFGDMGKVALWSPIVAMAPTPTGKGYWLLGRDGGVFSFGDAKFYGSTGGIRLNAPVVDIAPTATGRGYWFVAADGGVFSFGDAKFKGSTGGMRLWQPVASMTASADGRGYWLVAKDGGIFAFGVPFHGSLATTPGASAYGEGIRIRALASGRGYYILTSGGTALPFGTAARFGNPQSLGASAVDLMVIG